LPEAWEQSCLLLRLPPAGRGTGGGIDPMAEEQTGRPIIKKARPARRASSVAAASLAAAEPAAAGATLMEAATEAAAATDAAEPQLSA
jgi:hypothetical protein